MKQTAIVFLAIVLAASPAHASSIIKDQQDVSLKAPGIDFDTRLELTLHSFQARPRGPRPNSELFDFMPPRAALFRLRLRVNKALHFVVGADISGQRSHPEAIDFNSYFTPGFEIFLGDSWIVFVEDTMPTNAVTGAPFRVEEENRERGGLPDIVWDGHRLSSGLRLRHGSFSFEAAPVFYILSKHRRSSYLGARASVTVKF